VLVFATAVAVCLCASAAFSSPPAGAVYNAPEVPWHEHSEVVEVLSHVDGGTYGCGGTLIDDSWVLTAAHCVTKPEEVYGCSTKPWEEILSLFIEPTCYVAASQSQALYAGWSALSPSSLEVRTSGGTATSVAESQVFPGYALVFTVEEPGWQLLPCLWTCAKVNTGSLFASGDLALLRLQSPTGESGRSRPAPSDALITALRAVTALGWGDTDPGPPASSSSVLRESSSGGLALTDPPTLPGCDPDAMPFVDQVPPGMVLCVYSPSGTQGTGSGDSGGPLYAVDNDGQRTQIGVTSFGPPTGVPSGGEPTMFASVPRMIKWIRSKTGIGEASGSGADNVATALVIDNSGSMSGNDPALMRRDAAKSYVNTAVDGDHVGAIGFESSAYEIAPIGRMPDSGAQLLAQLDSSIFAGGGTNIGAGLSVACTMLEGASLPAKRAAILLTDGEGGYGGESNCFAVNGWKVFTVGLGSGVNEALLQQIADDTGGIYQPVPDALNLQCEFEKVRALIAGATASPCQADLIQAGETALKFVTVAARTAQIVFSTRWPGSNIGMKLTTPSGREITPSTSSWDVSYDAGPTHKTYVVKIPEPGEWTVELYGDEVDLGGESVVFGSSPIPFDNQLPSLTPEASASTGASPMTVQFDANAIDPDGTVDQVLWDFGDGSVGSGQQVSHTYVSPGLYTPKATAIDDDGEPATAASSVIEVVGQPPSAGFTVQVAGRTVAVDASRSHDPNGSIARYGWAFDSDGSLDASGAAPKASWTYPTDGTKRITLGVESSDGEYERATHTVSVGVLSPGPAAGSAAVGPVARRSGGIAFAGRVARWRGCKVFVRLRCLGETDCRGTLTLLTLKGRHHVRHRQHRRAQTSRRRGRSGGAVIGRGRFAVAPGKRRTVRIRFTRAGKRLVKEAGKRGLRAQLVGPGLRKRTVRLKPRSIKSRNRSAESR
jgi:PKD repeat protein